MIWRLLGVRSILVIGFFLCILVFLVLQIWNSSNLSPDSHRRHFETIVHSFASPPIELDKSHVVQPLVQPSQPTGSCQMPLWQPGLPTLYVVTPTYPRAEQLPELTRFAQTLMNVPNVIWVVSDETKQPTPSVTSYLKECGLKYAYLTTTMPSMYKKLKKKPRGVANRLAGLEWVRKNAKEGVLYFADDDNSYDIRIFEEMRRTRRVSMFPVGLVTELGVSTPIVRNGAVVGFYDGWVAKRKFPVDMAGFAVSLEYLLTKPKATMPFKPGYEEDVFLQTLEVDLGDIEPLAFNCTKIWVWHTQTKKNEPAKSGNDSGDIEGTNLPLILEQLWRGG